MVYRRKCYREARDRWYIWIELLGPHRFIRFKIEEAKLYSLKQAIIFYDTTPITSIIHNGLFLLKNTVVYVTIKRVRQG